MLRKYITGPLGLVLMILIIYVPFLGNRVVRTAGDEKVYVSQAIEMEKAGSWFVQTLNNEPDYFKGPLHYILVRIGFMIFGHDLWATLYMNLIFILIGSLAVYSILRFRIPQNQDLAFWGGSLFAMSLGIFAHSFASQMEVGLACFFAVAFWLLDRTPLHSGAYAFWILAGMAGWLKSPLHAAFLGASALLYWSLTGEIFERVWNRNFYLAAVTGILVGLIGYLPAYVLDPENFYHKYILKETLFKNSSGQAWYIPIVSTFGFYLFPWVFTALIGYGLILLQPWKVIGDSKTRKTFVLAVSLCLPSVCFFIYHSYRFENYNIPVISAVIIGLALSLAHAPLWSLKFNRYLISFQAILFIFLGAVALGIQIYFKPSPEWWPAWTGPVCFALCLVSAVLILIWNPLSSPWKPGLQCWAMVLTYVALGILMSRVGEREILDLKLFLNKNSNPIAYFNPDKNIWNEWGQLSLVIHQPIENLPNAGLVIPAFNQGKTILVQGPEHLERFKHEIHLSQANPRYTVTPWKRWRTRGKSEDGENLWKKAIVSRDLELLTRDFYIVTPDSK